MASQNLRSRGFIAFLPRFIWSRSDSSLIGFQFTGFGNLLDQHYWMLVVLAFPLGVGALEVFYAILLEIP